MGNIVISYYICDYKVAKLHCSGLSFKRVHYYTWEDVSPTYTLYNGWRFPVGKGDFNVALLINLTDKLQLLLALSDPLFRKILCLEEMSDTLIGSLSTDPWEII